MADKTWRFCGNCGEPLVHTVSSKPSSYDVKTGKPQHYLVTVQCTTMVGKAFTDQHTFGRYRIKPEEREWIGIETIEWSAKMKEGRNATT